MNKTFPGIIALLICTIISCKAYYIPTGSMEDGIRVGDHIFMKYIYNYTPIRGDVVIFRSPHDKEKEYIKRVIALPGERFEIKDEKVYINGRVVPEKYAKGSTEFLPFYKFEGVINNKIVPEGNIVVLGDNRENSMDSRHFGYVKMKDIIGKAYFLYWNTGDILKGTFTRFGCIE